MVADRDKSFIKLVISGLKYSVAFILGMVATIMALWYFEAGALLARGVTQKGVLALRPGLAANEVIKLMGVPLQACRSINKPNLRAMEWTGSWVWTYGTPSPLLGLGAGLEMVVFVDDNELVSAYIENYDLGVYGCDKYKCPEIYQPEIFNKLR